MYILNNYRFLNLYNPHVIPNLSRDPLLNCPLYTLSYHKNQLFSTF